MIRKRGLGLFAPLYRVLATNPRLASTASPVSTDQKPVEETTPEFEALEEELRLKEEEIERKRNKSRLKPSDRRLLLEHNPHPNGPKRWEQGTVKYLRRLYGRYGAASGIDPAICWPYKEELEEQREYERVAFPYTIPEVVQQAQIKQQEKDERMRKRQEELVARMEKLEQWKADFYKKIAKKEGEVLAAKQKKERLMEEVRMHFGYTVDPKEEKFKEMLEKKEKEQRKAEKEARKLAKQEEMLNRLLSKKVDKKSK